MCHLQESILSLHHYQLYLCTLVFCTRVRQENVHLRLVLEYETFIPSQFMPLDTGLMKVLFVEHSIR